MSKPKHRLALPVGTVVDKYQIDDHLGAGGFGIVYKARHVALDRVVALKEYLPGQFATREGGTVYPLTDDEDCIEQYSSGLERFKKEARMLVNFEHPHIISCSDLFEANSTAYLVMAYEDGRELSELLSDRARVGEPLTEAQILRIVIPVLSGLAEIHDRDGVHCDIKPSNIFIRRKTEAPVLIDFGAAKTNVSQRQNTVIFLSNGYAPPEQENAGLMGPWTDIYAVGATMWLMVSGQQPISAAKRENSASDPMDAATEIGRSKYSQGFLAAIDKALRLNPQDRFQTAQEFVDALKQGNAGSSTVVADDEPLTVRVPKDKRPTPPPGANIAELATSLSPSGNAARERSSMKEQDRTRPSLNKGLIVAIALVIAAAIAAAIAVGFWHFSPTPDKPDRDTIAAKIDRMYDHSHKAQYDLEVAKGFESDRIQLEAIARNLKDDPKELEDTQTQIRNITTSIQRSQVSAGKEEEDVIETAFRLAQDRRKWPDVIDDVYKEKIDLEIKRGASDKANLMDAHSLAIKRAASKANDQEAREDLKQALKLSE